MQLETGRMLANFRVGAKLGEGGMGEVYQATDTKLDRDVAIKVLPEAVATAPDRLTRFEREARALAALNHPNVAGIYQVEHVEGVHFLVMELAQGQTLAARIAQGALGVDEALPIALQIAEAVEAAHDRGIIHRDLKPANVMLAPDGQAKVLDFGLAKAMDVDPTDSSMPPTLATHSPTFTAHMTGVGMLMGTAAYMSPEQARGDVADRRSDVWAFGVVLFEMLTGKMVYPGKTISDTLAGVLAREPGWQELPAGTPLPVRRLLQRCLHKESSERLQAIGEARIAIRRYLADPSAETAEQAASAEAAATPSGRKWLTVAAAPLLVLAAALAWVLKPGPPPPLPLQIEASLAVEAMPLMNGIASSLVLSRDGSLLAYVTGIGTNPSGKIRVRDTHRFDARYLAGTERGYNVFFSPDARWLGFVTPNEMKKVAISGGAPLTLCEVNRSRGADWGEDGTIVFTADPGSGLSRIPAAGGEPEPLTELDEDELSHRWPQFLPGGTHVLYTAYTSSNRDEGLIKIVDLSTGQSEVVHRGGTYARYAASGHLLYWREATVFAVPFDLQRRQMTATPVPVLQGVAGNPEGGAHFDVANDGTLIYLPGIASQTIEVERTLMSVDRAGKLAPITKVKGQFASGFAMSPDQKSAAVTRWVDGNGDIWIIDLERDTPTRLTFDDAVDLAPAWSPDGRTVYFTTQRGAAMHLYRKPADGSAEAEQLQETEHDQWVADVSRDGRLLLYAEDHAKTKGDLWVLPLDGDGEPEPFLVTRFAEYNARFSPDGNWIAYESDESGQRELYVRPYPGPGGKWQVSAAGGRYPRWSPDGRKLFFIEEDEVYEVSIASEGQALRAGRPEVVASLDPALRDRRHWSLAPDTNRFLFIQDPASASPEMAGENHALVRFTFHWFEELERLLDGTR